VVSTTTRIQHLTSISSIAGEFPPPPPRTCLGRDELIERIVGLAENLTPIALIGAGGIGKTSIALTTLHHGRIKNRFGDNRRFIRCDQFPASRAHFLNRLSKVIGAGVENPEDLTPLRPFLSAREMILFLDNAESILDPHGMEAREIYDVVEELSRFETICLCITSRISNVPRHCERPTIPTLSMESACNIFYGIYNHSRRSGIVDDLVKRLDFHALSITLLATVAFHNMWDYNRLAREWDTRRTQALRTDYNESLAATIELSLASPTFHKLGPDARDLLGVIAFFPQGISDDNLDWLFPAVPDRANAFDKFCTLSLTYRNNGFITMLAPLRDYFSPKEPLSSPLFHTTKEHYFRRLSVVLDPDRPGFNEARWITSEDVNVEHLLDVFTSIDASSPGLWAVCARFMEHLHWHKPRLVVLGPKIDGLPDDHPYKPQCLFELSRLFGSIGNYVEEKRTLTLALKLWRERGDNFQVAETLRFLSNANRLLGLHGEGIAQAKEALGIYEQFDDKSEQVGPLLELVSLFYDDDQLDAAEEAASRLIDLSTEGNKPPLCECYRLLGRICRSRGETDKAINHFEKALGIASSFNWNDLPFWIHYNLVELFLDEDRFDDAQVAIERAKSHTVDDPYNLGQVMELQAWVWYRQRRFEEAKSEALRAADTYESLGAAKDVEDCRDLLQWIEEGMKKTVTSGGGISVVSPWKRWYPPCVLTFRP